MALPEDVNNEEEENDFFDIAGDVLAAPFRGIEGAFQGAYNLADYLAFDILPDYDTRFLGTSKTMAGGAVEGIAQFATGFVPLFGLAGRAGALAKAGTVTKGVVAGAATDFTFFNGQEARLSNLLREHFELRDPVTEFLAHDEDEGEIEGRLKNVLEGLGLEAVAGGFIAGLRGIKRGRKAKDEGADAVGQAQAVSDVLKGGRVFVDDESSMLFKKQQREDEAVLAEAGIDIGDVPEVDLNAIDWDAFEMEDVIDVAPAVSREEMETLQAGGKLIAEKETETALVKTFELPSGSKRTVMVDKNNPERVVDFAPEYGVSLDASLGKIRGPLKKDFFEKTLASGKPMTVRDALEDLSGRTNGEVGQYKPILKKLLALGEDTGIEAKLEIRSEAADIPEGLPRGSFYDGNKRRVVIDDKEVTVRTNPVYNLLHEATHAVTVDNVNKYYDAAGFKNIDINDINARSAAVDEVLKRTDLPKPIAEMFRMFKKADAMRDDIVAAGADESLYWIKNPAEFMSMAFADPQIQKALKGIQYTPKMTMWEKVVNTVKSFFGRGVSKDLANNIVSRVGEIAEMKLPGQRRRSIDFAPELPKLDPKKPNEFLQAVPEKFRGYAEALLDPSKGTPRLPQFALETDGDVVVLKDILEQYYKENPDKVTVTDAITDIDEAIENNIKLQAKEGEAAEKVLRDVRISQQAYREQAKALIQNVSEIADEAFDNGYGDVSITKLKNAFQQLLTVADVYRRIGRETAITLQARREDFGKRKLGLNEAETEVEGIRKEFVNNSGNMKPERMVKLVREHIDPDDLEGSLARLLKTAKKAQGKHFLDMPTEYWMNSILSGPKTQMVNIMGNVLTQVMTTLEAVAGGIASGNMDVVKAVIASWSDSEMFKEAGKFAKQAFKDQENLLDPSNRAFEEGQRAAITGQRISESPIGGIVSDSAKDSIDKYASYIRLPSRLLLTSDEFFKQLAYRRAARLKAAMSGIQQGIRDPKDLANHINKTVDTIVTEGGRMMSEEGLVREASLIADKKGLTGKDKAEFVIDYKDKNFNPDASALMQFAAEDAQYLTFTKELQDKTLGKALQDATNKLPYLRLVVPFVRTPTNILKFAFERTPFVTVLKEERERLFNEFNSTDPILKARARGKVVTAGLTMGALVDVAFNNREFITGGGPSNEREKEALMATGWRPYSIKIGDTYYSYQRLDPVATPLGVVADLVETGIKEDKAFDESFVEHAATSMMLALTRNATNKSYLAGIQMWADALGDPDRYIEKLGRNYTSSLVPNLISQMADYDTQSIKETRSVMDAVKRKLGLRGSLDTKRNILGEEYKAEQWMGTGFINPIQMSTKKDDPILNEMASLNHAFRNPPPSLGGQIDLLEYENDKGQSAYDRQLELLKTVKMRGLTVRQSLNKLIKSKSYQRLSPESEPGLPSPRIQQINSILTRYRKEAKRQMLREYPELDRQFAALTRAKAGFRTGMQREDVLELLAQ
jgi:hypothetical protein